MLVHEGVLPVRPIYRWDELQEVTIKAGLEANFTQDQLIAANFAFNPSGLQNIFAMEGAANEHFGSTGINDCASVFRNCQEESGHARVPHLIPSAACQARVDSKTFGH